MSELKALKERLAQLESRNAELGGMIKDAQASEYKSPDSISNLPSFDALGYDPMMGVEDSSVYTAESARIEEALKDLEEKNAITAGDLFQGYTGLANLAGDAYGAVSEMTGGFIPSNPLVTGGILATSVGPMAEAYNQYKAGSKEAALRNALVPTSEGTAILR